MVKNIPISKKNYSKAILNVASVIGRLYLSDREIDILSCIIDNKFTRIDNNSKEFIRRSLNIDKYGTNNFIKSLKDKGVLVQIEDSRGEYYIHPNITDLFKDKNISFTFELVV